MKKRFLRDALLGVIIILPITYYSSLLNMGCELSINWDVAFVVHILVGIVAAFMYKEYEVDSHVDSVVL